MRRVGSRPGRTGIMLATACAALAVVWALLDGFVEPPVAWHELLWFRLAVPPGFELAIGAAALLLLGIGLRRRALDDAAFALLASASVLAGAASLAVADRELAGWPGRAGDGPFLPMLGAYAGLFVMSAIVLAAWALAPSRRLTRWIRPFAITVVTVTAIGAVLRAWGYRTVSEPGALAVAGPDLSAAWRSGLPVGLLALTAVAGALHAAARRRLGAPGDPTRRRLVEPAAHPAALVPTAVVAVAAWVADLAIAGDAVRSTGALPSLLWLLVAVVALRWSEAAAWAAVAASLVLSAEPLVGPVAFGGSPLDGALAQLAIGWVALTAAVHAGWRALAAVTAARGPRRLAWMVPVVLVLLPFAMVATGGGASLDLVLWPEPGVPVPALWTPLLAAAPVLAALVVAAGGRLVDALAEAEADADASGRLVISRYLAIAGSELVGGQAAIRWGAAQAERQRLASEIHADVLPVLASVRAQAAGLAPDELTDRLRAAEAEVRGLLDERRHVILEELGLVQALEWLAERAQDRAPCAVELAIDDASTDERPPRDIERAAFRVAQLALDNALRHAQPHTVRIDVLARIERICLSVADDGAGASGSVGAGRRAMPVIKAGYGLIDMQLQASRVRGQVRVSPRAGGGTLVHFDWPAAAAADGATCASSLRERSEPALPAG